MGFLNSFQSLFEPKLEQDLKCSAGWDFDEEQGIRMVLKHLAREEIKQ